MTRRDHKRIWLHAQRVDAFNRQLEQFKSEIRAPYATEAMEWWDREHSKGVFRSRYPDGTVIGVRPRDDKRWMDVEKLLMQKQVDFKQKYQPRIEPFDTPELIRKKIAEQTGITAILSESKTFTVQDYINRTYTVFGPEPVDEAMQIYVNARQRVMAFSKIAPSIKDDPNVREAASADIGIQNLLAWCEEASSRPNRIHWPTVWTVLDSKIVSGVVLGNITGVLIAPLFHRLWAWFVTAIHR